jgi:hypothetical protein
MSINIRAVDMVMTMIMPIIKNDYKTMTVISGAGASIKDIINKCKKIVTFPSSEKFNNR